MELDKKVRWRNFRNELYDWIVDDKCSHFPDDIIERVKAYKSGLYASPKVYVDGYAVNDGSWIKYCYNGQRRCKNKEEIGRYLFGYVSFLLKVGIDDRNELWYYSLCFLIDRLEYREGIFGCSGENKERIESTIKKACAMRLREVLTAKIDKRKYCLDPKVVKNRTKGMKSKKDIIGEKTRMQKINQKKITDEKIGRLYDPNLKSIRKNANKCGVSPGRIYQWIKEFSPR